MDKNEMYLPGSIQSLINIFEENEGKNLTSLLMNEKLSLLHPDSKHILQYSVPSLQNGRPINEVIIFLAGKSGTGKSTTINRLFEDEVCQTSSSSSETSYVKQCIKKLKVTNVTPTILADLKFVDVPGSSDTNINNDKINFKRISNFRKNYCGLKKREFGTFSHFHFTNKIYPNLVLLTINASDSRTEGPSSSFNISVKGLREHDLVDKARNNLIVVATFAASMGVNSTKYLEKAQNLQKIVQNIIAKEFFITNVPVVFVENDPDSHNLSKDTDSDFYALPDGTLSHANLIQEMQKLFSKNKDKLALLLSSWYFNPNCPEKNTTCEIQSYETNSDDDTVENDNELIPNEKSIDELRIGIKQLEFTPTYNFQSLGYAYCPVTESIKHEYLFRKDDINNLRPDFTISVGNAKFCVPPFVKCYIDKGTSFKKLSCDSKEHYESRKTSQYGLEANVILIVGVNSSGKWENNSSTSSIETVVSVLYEKKICSMQIDSPEQYLSLEFLEALNSLPSTFEINKCEAFTQFFGKYGTHLICKQSLGGSIKFDCNVSKSQFNKQNKSEIEMNAKGIFKGLSAEGNFNTESASKKLTSLGVSEHQISIDGGDPLMVTSLDEITSQDFQDWLKSVDKQPKELEHSRQLYPFYNFATPGKQGALKEASLCYLRNGLKVKQINKREEIAKAGEKKAKDATNGCFPASTSVLTRHGYKFISQLQYHDKVLTVNNSGLFVWTQFCTFLHREDNREADFLRLFFSNGIHLSASDSHLLPVVNDHGKKVRYKNAKDMNVGDRMFYVGFDGVVSTPRVVSISLRKEFGVYCPFTMKGTFLANGYMVTCYADIQSFTVAHLACGPLRSWYSIKSIFLKKKCEKNPNGIHEYALMLLKLRTFFSNKLHLKFK